MNEIQTNSFNYFALDADIAIEARAAAERVKVRLRRTAEDIVEIGKELLSIKGKLNHGQFLPWIEAEFQMSDRTARNFIQVASRFKSEIISDFNPTVLYQLAAPSTPDEVVEKATEKAESGEKVSVEDVKRWKAELEQARQHASSLEIAAIKNQKRAEALEEKLDEVTNESISRFKEAETLRAKLQEASNIQPQIVEKEILPPDYEGLKKSLEVAKAEAEEAAQKLKDLRKKQEQEISAGVQEAIKMHKNDLETMERKRAQAESRLEELNSHIKLLGDKAETHKFHDSIVGQWEHDLIELSLIVTEFHYIPETHNKWLRLAKNFKDASQAIEMLIEEKSGRSLNDRPDTGSDNP